MISKIKDKVPELPRPEYPVLKIYRDGDFIVLFESTGRGVVVWSIPASGVKIGESSGSWAEYDFKPFDGEIVLSND